MRKKVRKSLAFLLALALVVSVMSGLGLSVSAEEEITSPGTETVQPVEEEVKAEEKETGTEESKETGKDSEEKKETVEPETAAGQNEPEEQQTAQALFDRLMACETLDEINAILDDLTEEENALLDQFTEEQNAALEAKIKGLGGYDTATNNASLAIGNVLNHAEVAYVYFTKDDTNWEFTPVQSGQTVYKNLTDGALVFFVKPEKDYLLTEYKANGNNFDLYGITDTPAEKSKIGYVNRNSVKAQELLNKAADLGYVGYYGFSYDGSGGSVTFNITGQQPQMTVSATASPDKDIKPGDTVTFTVTVTPDTTIANSEVTDTKITSLTINDKKYQYTRNDDGTYTVEYTVTEEDWENQKVRLDVSAELEYTYQLYVTDRAGQKSYINTKTTIHGKANTECKLASKQGVVYRVKFDPANKANPDLFPDTPVDTDEYFSGDPVTVKEYNMASVNDDVNKGTWTFDGWYKDEKKVVGNTLTMGDNPILLTGTWTFKEWPTADLTIKKQIYVDGVEYAGTDFNDTDYTFTVSGNNLKSGDQYTVGGETVTVDTNNTLSVTIKGASEATISGLITGDYTITETAPDSTDKYTYKKNTGTGKVTLAENGETATISNYYETKTFTVTIQKVVTGNMGDTNQKFSFTSGSGETFELKDGGKKGFTVKYGEAFTVTETDANKNGYTTSYKVDDGDAKDGGTCAIENIKADTTITFTNEKQIDPPTGIITTIAPYAIMVVLAAGAGVYFVYSRRRHNG